MDLASIIGFVIIFASILVTVLASFTPLGDALPKAGAGLLDTASFVCVIGGMAGATFVTFSMANMGSFAKIFGQVIKPQMESNQSIEMMQKLIEIGTEARRGGILSVEPLVAQLDDPFLQKAMQLAVDGRDADEIRSTLTGELTFMSNRHDTGASMFDTMNKYCPAFGMIGTLLGLIAMLGNMGGAGMDISALTGGMATALITTLYGSVFANCLFAPVCDNLKSKSKAEATYREIAIEGVAMIASTTPPPQMRSRFQSFLAPQDQDALDAS